MANSVMMYAVLGYAEDHPSRAIARKSIEKLLVIKDHEAYCQPCVSPIWDTALTAHAMIEAGGEAAQGAAKAALDWLKPMQVLDVEGDWIAQAPRRSARRLGVPVCESALSGSRRHRGRGDGDGSCARPRLRQQL